ncbi:MULTISPECIES: hypothetical protein [Streptomycetaceae]|uniref:hypothetical protein n=1 Tax=Streptomycetaceae TaxID=2062 RepID=UPI00094030DF|nr:hypothetical protein [Streptomyces sp. CB02056]
MSGGRRTGAGRDGRASPAQPGGRGPGAARRLTGELRAAIEEVRSAVLVLAGRVRAAHRARVWTVRGYGGWAAYAGAEFGVSRSTAYRLLDLAAAAEAIEATVRREAGLELSHAWDTGLVLPVRAVVDLKDRIAELTDLIAERLADAGASGGRPPDAAVVAEIVARSVADVRSRPDVPTAEPAVVHGPDSRDTERWHSCVARGRDLARQRLDIRRELGLLALQVAPGYLCDREAEETLGILGEEIGSTAEQLLAARRYALTGDPRAVEAP